MQLILNNFRCLALISCLVFLTSLPVFAHKVILYAYVDDQKIVAEGGFGDGSVAKEVPVKIYDSEGNLLAEGITDQHGVCELPVPAKTDLKLVLEAGMGHQVEYMIAEGELPDVSTTGTRKTQEAISAVDGDQLRLVISQELKKELAVINKKLVQMESEQKPGVTEILGGIGYIFGIMGMVLYFKRRRADHV